MKITFVSPVHNMSGGNRVISIHARELHERGHDVTLIAPPREKMGLRERIKTLLRNKDWYQEKPADYDFYEGAGYKVITLDSHRPVHATDIPDSDIIIATWWKTVEWVNEMPLDKGTRVHLIQGYDATEYSPAEQVDATWKMPFYKIAVSQWLAKLGHNRMGVEVDAVIHNSVDHKQFHAPERNRNHEPTVGFLFSDYPGKGTDIAIEVLNRIKLEIPALKGVCFGHPSPGSAIELPSWIEFTRNPAQERIRELYASCDVWLYPSDQDGFGLTPVEAMACRCPVVTTRVGAMPEIICNGCNGYLTDCNDVDALTSRTKRILTCSPSDWLEFSNHALQTTRDYSWKDAGDQFEAALYEARGQEPKRVSIAA